MQTAFLETASLIRWTRVIPSELFHQNLFSVNHTIASLDVGPGGEVLHSLDSYLNTLPDLRISHAWRTSFSGSRLSRVELPAGGMTAVENRTVVFPCKPEDGSSVL